MNNTITLDSLSRAAEAMGCELVYAIVPKASLSSIIRERAHEVAHARLATVGHTMRLEEQAVDQGEAKAQEEMLARRLITEWPRVLWEDVHVDHETRHSED